MYAYYCQVCVNLVEKDTKFNYVTKSTEFIYGCAKDILVDSTSEKCKEYKSRYGDYEICGLLSN